MEQLEQSLSFKKVHEQFASGEYSIVIDKLLPLLDQDAESASMTEVCMRMQFAYTQKSHMICVAVTTTFIHSLLSIDNLISTAWLH